MEVRLRPRFWETLPLAELTTEEWEAVCDGCAKCCLVKLEDADDGTVYFTDVHCFLLDCTTCRCGDYANRTVRVPTCIELAPGQLDEVFWMPLSCSYRRLAEGRGLAPWHHLLTNDPDAIHRAGASIRGRALSETEVDDDLEDRLVGWPATEP
jgi:uncharacterized cysteine cluster protein YcgN (CxxCxxCC family)